MTEDLQSTQAKALRVNQDRDKYGTIAEIGAGQEVARWFFRAGATSGTVAKTISAYDMRISDAIYGPSSRYVSRERLTAMVRYEFNLLQERLAVNRGAESRFFAFANTAKAKSTRSSRDDHAWLGIECQHHPDTQSSEILLHVRLLDNENIQQQDALGILGVNLIYGAFYCYQDIDSLLTSLLDNLNRNRVEVDMIKVSGQDFESLDNRLLSLKLVQLGLADAALFGPDGGVIQPAEKLHKKHVLVERGSFRPVTQATLEMLNSAHVKFCQQEGVVPDEVVELAEISLTNPLEQEQALTSEDFLARADTLCALGKNVLISNYDLFHKLAAYVFRYTRRPSALVLGVPNLQNLFDERYYANLDGGILESFGRLFKNKLKLYAYPWRYQSGEELRVGNLNVPKELRHLYSHLVENAFIEELPAHFERPSRSAREVLRMIQSGDEHWREYVPAKIVAMIEERQLFRNHKTDAYHQSNY